MNKPTRTFSVFLVITLGYVSAKTKAGDPITGFTKTECNTTNIKQGQLNLKDLIQWQEYNINKTGECICKYGFRRINGHINDTTYCNECALTADCSKPLKTKCYPFDNISIDEVKRTTYQCTECHSDSDCLSSTGDVKAHCTVNGKCEECRYNTDCENLKEARFGYECEKQPGDVTGNCSRPVPSTKCMKPITNTYNQTQYCGHGYECDNGCKCCDSNKCGKKNTLTDLILDTKSHSIIYCKGNPINKTSIIIGRNTALESLAQWKLGPELNAVDVSPTAFELRAFANDILCNRDTSPIKYDSSNAEQMVRKIMKLAQDHDCKGQRPRLERCFKDNLHAAEFIYKTYFGIAVPYPFDS